MSGEDQEDTAKKVTPKDRTFSSFMNWKESQTNDDFKQIVWRGQLKRKEIAKACGFAKSVLQSNKDIERELEILEDKLRKSGVLPRKTEARIAEERKNRPKPYESGKNERAMQRSRLQELEQENMELKAKLRRYEELSEVIMEIGVLDV